MTTDEPPVVIDWSEHAERLSAAVDDDAAWYAETARHLVEPGDGLAVDVGCGGAGMAMALSAALPSDASVVGLDGDDEVLAAAQRRVADAQIDGARVWLIRADLDHDLRSLPAVARNADIMWASASIHHAADQQSAIDALAAHLAPGGRLALAEGGLRGRHLPWDLGVGEPGLENRLLGAEDRWFGRMRESLPGTVRMPYGWTTALRKAGLTEVTTRSTMFEQTAPLAHAELTKVLDNLAHRVERASESGDLDADDAAAWARLLDRDDDVWLGHRDDIHSLSARSVHVGRRAA
ncbi:class I SAM-dependent methyltransferase [Phytoactinopolyspora endophytica]|uniref:class I SAM-dependent methyltransferase n=1 Tax=Phytoactinopolyspora endophytica TaxID=1642495 RepID=UPI00101C77BD|nr:class I SAM-dependent methyltransferase [Phytoactinopolyspora endophytica]